MITENNKEERVLESIGLHSKTYRRYLDGYDLGTVTVDDTSVEENFRSVFFINRRIKQLCKEVKKCGCNCDYKQDHMCLLLKRRCR